MKICALCNGEAAIYCSSDSAFLCLICDAKVHEANFLVSRHVRDLICSHCNGFTQDRISGVGFQFSGDRKCLSCSPVTPTNGGDLDCLSSSSSSACVSTTQSSSSSSSAATSRRKSCCRRSTSSSATAIRKGQKKAWRVDFKAEGILVNWCRQLGLVNGDCVDVVRTACEALGVCLDELTNLPFRVSLVASLWFGIRFCMIGTVSTWQGIKRLEEISGVPAKVIASAESKLQRLFKAANNQQRQRQRQRHSHEVLEEGWAES